jgi:hypothetical protein
MYCCYVQGGHNNGGGGLKQWSVIWSIALPVFIFAYRVPVLEAGDAHGHGPYPITNGERTLVSAWLKQGRDWLML